MQKKRGRHLTNMAQNSKIFFDEHGQAKLNEQREAGEALSPAVKEQEAIIAAMLINA